MPQYTIRYLEDGKALKSESVTTGNGLEAWAEAKKAFTIVQANLGARDFEVLDQAGAVLMRHVGSGQDNENDSDRRAEHKGAYHHEPDGFWGAK